MSVWLTPDLRPFIGGTYFPPRDQGRQPGLKTVLLRIIEQVAVLSLHTHANESGVTGKYIALDGQNEHL